MTQSTSTNGPPHLPRVDRKPTSKALDYAYDRNRLRVAISFLRDPEYAEAAALLAKAIALLPPAMVYYLGCQRCNSNVPLDQPDLIEDRLCRSCADDYDAALAARRAVAAERRKAKRRVKLAA